MKMRSQEVAPRMSIGRSNNGKISILLLLTIFAFFARLAFFANLTFEFCYGQTGAMQR